MKFSETFLLSLKNIMSSKVRTFLTMLGIIIGVTAVIIIVGLGNGLKNYVTDSFSSLGTNTLTVKITGRGTTRTFSIDQMYKLVEDNSDKLQYISPIVSMSNVKIGSDSLSSTTASGVSEDYFTIKDYTVSQGRGLLYYDIATRNLVCVIGSYLNDTYYNGAAVGQTLRINGSAFKIIGVLKQIDSEEEEGGSDDCVFVPYSTASRLTRTGTFSNYLLTVTNEDITTQAVSTVEAALYSTFENSDYYKVTSMSEMLDTMTSMINVMVGVLAGIAGISLAVGGVGIMNIMLVSVTERTREIGIRKALGAKERTILQQFVIEAATTSALGGILGILLGYGLSAVATVVVTNLMSEQLTVAPSLFAVLLAFGISVGIGVVFGFLPAKKAAHLNPIDALRYD